MINLSEYLTESRRPKKLEMTPDGKYFPRDRDELVRAICKVIDEQLKARPGVDLKVIDLNGIDTSRVTEMYSIFESAAKKLRYANSFDFLVDQWDVSNVTSFYECFKGAMFFTGQGIENWKVTSKCKSLSSMFEHTQLHEELDLSNWDLSNTHSLESAFMNCTDLERLILPEKMPKLMTMENMCYMSDKLSYVELPMVTTRVEDVHNAFYLVGARSGDCEVKNLELLKLREKTKTGTMFNKSKVSKEQIAAFRAANGISK
jgi:hypothetical protein